MTGYQCARFKTATIHPKQIMAQKLKSKVT